MAYGYRRNNNYRRTYRNNRYVKKAKGGKTKELVDGSKQTWMSAGIRSMPYVLKSLSMLKSLVNAEPKFVDTVSTGVAFANTMTYVRLTSIAQGTTDSTRVGNKILLKDLLIRWTCSINTAATGNNIVRIILFVDKQTEGALPINPDPLATANADAPLSMDESKRYVIIRDWHYVLNTTTFQSTAKKHYKILNFHCDFDGTGSTIGDAKENQIYLGFITSAASNFPSLSYYARVKYFDS